MTFTEATYKAMSLSINKGAHVVILYIPGNTYHVLSHIDWYNMTYKIDLKFIAYYENLV